MNWSNDGTFQRTLMLATVCFGVISLLMLAWLFTTERTPDYKPRVAVAFDYQSDDPVVSGLVEDLTYRLRTHHAYRWQPVADENTDVLLTVRFIREGDRLALESQFAEQPVRIEGPVSAAHNLPGKFFSLLNQYIGSQ